MGSLPVGVVTHGHSARHPFEQLESRKLLNRGIRPQQRSYASISPGVGNNKAAL